MFPLTMQHAQRKHSVKITAWLLHYFEEHPEAALTTTDVIMRSRGISISDIATVAIEKSQRVSTIRAMKALSAKRPALRIMDGEGPCGQTIIFNSHDLRSYALARLKQDWLKNYQWSRNGRYSPERWDEAPLLKQLDTDATYIELLSPTGAWHLFVDHYIAKDAGDQARVVELEAAIQAMYDEGTRKTLAALAELNRDR
jgi:hypothetical protein